MRRKCYWCEKVRTAKYKCGSSFVCEDCALKMMGLLDGVLRCRNCGKEIYTYDLSAAKFTKQITYYDNPTIFCSMACALKYNKLVPIDKDGNEVEYDNELAFCK